MNDISGLWLEGEVTGTMQMTKVDYGWLALISESISYEPISLNGSSGSNHKPIILVGSQIGFYEFSDIYNTI